ncbi:MAG: DsbA family protein [Litoreibacter sp.]|nr:DsbA family protein [Litoreibacter sp.]MCY4335800.1 DsbA family protein [Litoreibacter sp.]
MNRNTLLSGAVILAAAVVGFLIVDRPSNLELPSTAAQAQTTDDAEIDTSIVQEMVLGEEGAPITFIEYASYTCPHCQRFHKDVFPQLKADYIDTGKVRFIYREVYFDGPGLWAGMTARCGGEERFFGMVDLIYENQQSWTQGAPAQVAANLKKMGKLAGMSDEQLDACLQDGEKARAMMALYQQNAEADGVRATPSFVINGELQGNMAYPQLKELLDSML